MNEEKLGDNLNESIRLRGFNCSFVSSNLNVMFQNYGSGCQGLP